MRKTFFVLFVSGLSFAGPQFAVAAALNDAVGAGDLVKVRQLIEAGADVNAKDDVSYTPLHRAVDVGSLEITQLLLDHNADEDAADKDGNTPLHLAAAKGRRKALALLITRSAKLNAANKDGATPLHLAVREAHIGTIEDLLNAGAEAEAQDKDGNTPLHVAAAKGQRKAVALLLNHTREQQGNANLHNRANATPLDLAMQQGQTQTVEFLLDAGAHTGSWDPDAEAEGAPPSEDLLSAALASGKKDMVGLVLKRGAVVLPQHLYEKGTGCLPSGLLTGMILSPGSEKIKVGGAALAQAALCGDRPLLTALMRASGTIDYAAAAQSWGSLMASGKPPSPEAFDMLFAKDPQLKAHATVIFDSYARIRLYASAPGQQDTSDSFLDFLLQKGVDTNTKDEAGNTLLHFAAGEGNLRMVKYLVEHRANPNAATDWGNTPLFRAVLSGNAPVVQYLAEHGAKVNAANELGNTPLHFAAARNLGEICALLIKKGAKVNAANAAGNTPLHQAVRFPEDFATAVLLLNSGANPRAQNADGYTPVHSAANRNAAKDGEDPGMGCYSGQIPCEATAKDDDLVRLAKELVKHKADTGATNKEGRTALDLAQRSTAHPALVAYLQGQAKKNTK